MIGCCEWRLGRTTEAEEKFLRVLEEERVGTKSPMAISFALLGMAAVALDARRSLILLTASDALLAREGIVHTYTYQAEFGVILHRAKRSLAGEEVERIGEEARRMNVDEMLAYALRSQRAGRGP
jgi:hypothetical protein